MNEGLRDRSADIHLAEMFLAAQQEQSDDLDPLVGQLAEEQLLARRHRASQGEAEFLDRWGAGIDSAEVFVAILSGLLWLALERFDGAERTEDERPAWVVLVTHTDRCLKLAEDVLGLMRRGSLSTAFSVLRTQLEVSVKARMIAAHPELGGPFIVYQARALWQNSANAHRALQKFWPPASEVVQDARGEANRLTREAGLMRGELGWAHDYLIAHDTRYWSLARDGRREDGPNLGDLERAAKIEPGLQAVRAETNVEVHGNLVRIPSGMTDEDKVERDAAMLLLVSAKTASLLASATFEFSGVFDAESGSPGMRHGIEELRAAVWTKIAPALDSDPA